MLDDRERLIKERKYREEFNVKGFTVRVFTMKSDLVGNLVINHNCFMPHYQPYKNDKPCDDQLKMFLKTYEDRLFTDEEIVAPCPTMDEYNRRYEFLKNYYIEQIDNSYANWGNYSDRVVYDPISDRFVNNENRDFVEKHIELYKQLNKVLKPTVFPDLGYNYSFPQKFMTYLTCLSHADEDDPWRQEAEQYISEHAREMAKDYYRPICRELTLKLIEDGYIKTPTMRKLLEMANKCGDTQLSAIILDKLQNKKVSKNRFDI